jgi:hypothetical protein
LSEKDVLDRAFRALDELVGQQVTMKAANDVPPVALSAVPADLEPDIAASTLKGQAVELWCDHAGGRIFIVADEADAQEVIRHFGARRGRVWTRDEIELVASIEDQEMPLVVAAKSIPP